MDREKTNSQTGNFEIKYKRNIQKSGKEEEGKETVQGRNVKILFWNIAGITRKEKDFYDYLKEYDVIGLVETWLEEKDWGKIRKFLPAGWKWKFAPALRSHKKGRAKGGIITGVRNEILEKKEGLLESQNIQERKVKFGNMWYRIFTIYSSSDSDVWKELKEVLDDREEDGIIAGGDFNARIGDRGGLLRAEEIQENDTRATKDNVINKKGTQLLEGCEERGWHILNGNIQGDEGGSLTYIGEQGESVIDYILVGDNVIDNVERFEVANRIDSDHLPIWTQLNKIVDRKDGGEIYKITVQVWNEEQIKEYRRKTKEQQFKKETVDEDLQNITKAVLQNTEKKEITVGVKNVDRWWDVQCREN